jgi:hypothetical protein
MGDLRGETTDRRQTLRLQEALFHFSQIRTILKHVNVSAALVAVHALDGHIHRLSLAASGGKDDGPVQTATARRGLTHEFFVDFTGRTEITHLSADQARRRRFENPFGAWRGLQNCSVKRGDDQTFMHASQTTSRFVELSLEIVLH